MKVEEYVIAKACGLWQPITVVLDYHATLAMTQELRLLSSSNRRYKLSYTFSSTVIRVKELRCGVINGTGNRF